MAINLLQTNTAYVDFGNLTGVADVTELTVALCIKLTANPNTNEALLCQWGATASTQAFALYTLDTNEIAWLVHDDAGAGFSWRGAKTTALNIADGSTYWICARWKASESTVSLTINGTIPSLIDLYPNEPIVAVQNSSADIRVGYHPNIGTGQCLDADYAEIAIWSRCLTDQEALDYSLGHAPSELGENGRIFYFKALDTSTLTDEWGEATVTNHSGTDADHPDMSSASISSSLSLSLSASESASPSRSPSLSTSVSVSPSASASLSASPSLSISQSVSGSASSSMSASSSQSPSVSQSLSGSLSASRSASLSTSPSSSPSRSASPSQSPSATLSSSLSESSSPSYSPDPTDIRLIRRLRQSPHVSDEHIWQYVSSFQLDVQTGQGTPLGQGLDPQIVLQYSNDSGHTWSQELRVSAGVQGQYAWRAIWRRLGKSRKRTWRVVMTDPVRWHLLSAFVGMEKGTS